MTPTLSEAEILAQLTQYLLESIKREETGIALFKACHKILKERVAGKKYTKRFLGWFQPEVDKIIPGAKVWERSIAGMLNLDIEGGEFTGVNRISLFLGYSSDYGAAEYNPDTFPERNRCWIAAEKRNADRRALLDSPTLRALARHGAELLRCKAEIAELTEFETPGNQAGYELQRILMKDY